jgi:hypothetical protein
MLHRRESQRYQTVYVNVTSKRDISNCLCKCFKDIKLFVWMLHRSEIYQIVHVNVTSKRITEISNVYVNVTSKRDISNCLCECYSEARYIKLFMQMFQGYQIVYVNVTSKRSRDINCLCECYIEEKQRYQIVNVNVTSKRSRDIKLFM